MVEDLGLSNQGEAGFSGSDNVTRTWFLSISLQCWFHTLESMKALLGSLLSGGGRGQGVGKMTVELRTASQF